MTVKELYRRLEEYVPSELSEEWDNDGIMCCNDSSNEVRRVLATLDVTEDVVDYAIEQGFDLIISHHPLIFRPIGSITEDNHVSRKLIKLITNDIAVFSFHTRADKVKGGVNDQLCDLLGLYDAVPFGEGGLGRIGTLKSEITLEDFCCSIKYLLAADGIRMADAYNPVRRVALVGGDGKDYVRAAIAAGADTYLSGRIGYNVMEEAAEMGINLVEAGHYYTEFPITSFFIETLMRIDPDLYIETADSNQIRVL